MLGFEELEHGNVFSCPTCPYVFPITRKLVNSSGNQALNEVDDDKGDAELLQHVDATAVNYSNCNSKLQFQSR